MISTCWNMWFRQIYSKKNNKIGSNFMKQTKIHHGGKKLNQSLTASLCAKPPPKQ